MFCETRGRGGVTYFEESKRGNVPGVEGAEGHVFLRDPKGGQKNLVNENENL